MMMILQLSLFHFENLENFGHFAADLREVSFDLAECSGKRCVFGLDCTINR